MVSDQVGGVAQVLLLIRLQFYVLSPPWKQTARERSVFIRKAFVRVVL